MAPNRIFLVELLVEELQVFSRPQLAEKDDKPTSSDKRTSLDKPPSSDKRASLDKPASSDKRPSLDKPTSSDKPNTSDKRPSLDKPTSDKPATSDKSTSPDKPATSDKSTSSDKRTSLDKPNTSDKQPEQPAKPDEPTLPERCIRLQLNHLARCEVCEKDFGSQLDMERSKMGENCMFTLSDAELAAGPLTFRISAVERQPSKRGIVLGSWEEPATELFQRLAKNYDDANASSGEQKSESSLLSSDSCSRRSKPVSETIKSMYPLHTEQNVVIGCVILTLRLSCLGPRITQKVMFGARDSQTAITCFKSVVQEEEERFMKCVAYDAVNHPHPVICGPCEDKTPANPPASISSQEKIPCSPYDEYTAELNGNAICVRVEKNSDIKVMLDGEQKGCTQGCWTSLTLPEGVYALENRYVQRQENACRLPVIRGNLKYPAEQWESDFMMCQRKKPIRAEDYRKRPDPTRSVCMQTRDPEIPVSKTPCGIEICRKGYHDPNVDVFVLKLGKNKTSRDADATNQIELELRTPKGPMVEKRPKETRGCQVIEAEFEDLKKPAAPADDKSKKGKKGAKKADKKGDKKGKKK